MNEVTAIRNFVSHVLRELEDDDWASLH
jgi:hypothetical protein